jgi:hypothetical protein
MYEICVGFGAEATDADLLSCWLENKDVPNLDNFNLRVTG